MTQTITMTTIGFIRRVRALAAMGHPNEDVAQWLAVDVDDVPGLQASGSTSTCLMATLEVAYGRECMRPGRSGQTAARARGDGWRTAAAWDEDTIDQAAASPAGKYDTGYDAAEQAADDIIRRMSATGQTEREIAAYLRVSRATIQRRRAALGLCQTRTPAR